MEIVIERTVAAVPERVFDLYTDPDRVPEWRPAIAEIADRTGPMQAVGTTFTTRYRGRTPDSRGTVTASERPVRHVLEGAGAVRYVARLALAPHAEGTLLRFALTVRLPGGPLGRLARRLVVRRKVERDVAQELDRLARLAAGGTAPPG